MVGYSIVAREMRGSIPASYPFSRRVAEWSNALDCKSSDSVFAGSNPAAPKRDIV